MTDRVYEMKPCPLCGGDVDFDLELYNGIIDPVLRGKCKECYTNFELHATNKKLLIRKWNRRVCNGS